MGAIFLPLIIFLVKLIIDFGIVKGKLDDVLKAREEQESRFEKIEGMSNRVTVLEIKVERVEKDLVVAIDKRPVKRVPLDEEGDNLKRR